MAKFSTIYQFLSLARITKKRIGVIKIVLVTGVVHVTRRTSLFNKPSEGSGVFLPK